MGLGGSQLVRSLRLIIEAAVCAGIGEFSAGLGHTWFETSHGGVFLLDLLFWRLGFLLKLWLVSA